MTKPLFATNRALTILHNAPGSTLDQIIDLAGGEFDKRRLAAILNAQWIQGHVEKKRRDDNQFGFALTHDGQRWFDLAIAAGDSLQKNRAKKTLKQAVAEVKAQLDERKPENVSFPREKLRLLATAALASTKPLDTELRAACLLAIKEAA